jgi:hypothetical protein
MGARGRVLKVGQREFSERDVARFKFDVILGLYQFQNRGWGRIVNSGKDRIARCVIERMASGLTQHSDLDCVGEVLPDLVVEHESTGLRHSRLPCSGYFPS